MHSLLVFIDHSTGICLDPYTMTPIGRLAADGDFTLIEPSEAANAQFNTASLEAFTLVLPPNQQQENQLESQQQQMDVGMLPHQHHLPVEPNANEPPPLPPGWRAARDATGKVYYYHSKTRQTQWERPTLASSGADAASRGGDGRKRRHKHKLHLAHAADESASSDDSGDSDSDSQSLSDRESKGEFDATKSRFIKQVRCRRAHTRALVCRAIAFRERMNM